MGLLLPYCMIAAAVHAVQTSHPARGKLHVPRLPYLFVRAVEE